MGYQGTKQGHAARAPEVHPHSAEHHGRQQFVEPPCLQTIVHPPARFIFVVEGWPVYHVIAVPHCLQLLIIVRNA